MIPMDMFKFVHRLVGFSHFKILHMPYFSCILNEVSLCSSGWPRTLTPVSTSTCDGLKAYTTSFIF